MMIQNNLLNDWINEIKSLCNPDKVVFWEGTKSEYDSLSEECVRTGKAIRLNPKKRPNSLLFRSHPSDVARVEKELLSLQQTNMMQVLLIIDSA